MLKQDLITWGYLDNFATTADAMQDMADRFARDFGMDKETALREAEDVVRELAIS